MAHETRRAAGAFARPEPGGAARRAVLLALILLAPACGSGDGPPGEPGPAPAAAAAPSRPFSVQVTGSNYRWHITYPGPDGRLGTGDDLKGRRNLHLPLGADVTVELRSEDFAYGFYLPGFEILEVAMPGSPFQVSLVTLEEGRFELLGNQMCGYTHPELIGEVIVHPEGEYEDWAGSLDGS